MRTAVAGVGTALAVIASLAACGVPEEPPPPPSAPVEPACPPQEKAEAWARAHPEGSLPPDFHVVRILWCSSSEKGYQQLETDRVQPLLDALRSPSRPDDRGPCPASLELPLYLIAVGETAAHRLFVPLEKCSRHHPVVIRAVQETPWRPSTSQPGR
jgi:hypothetical protein